MAIKSSTARVILLALSQIDGDARARGRREALSLDAASEEIDNPHGEDPGWRLDRADTRRQLNEALAALPLAQRQTFVLHVEGDLSYREVAAILGISIGTVMSRLFYARRKLRGFLDHLQRLHDARI